MNNYEQVMAEINQIEVDMVTHTPFVQTLKNAKLARESGKKGKNAYKKISEQSQTELLVDSAAKLIKLNDELIARGVPTQQRIEIRKQIRRDIRAISAVIEPGCYQSQKQ